MTDFNGFICRNTPSMLLYNTGTKYIGEILNRGGQSGYMLLKRRDDVERLYWKGGEGQQPRVFFDYVLTPTLNPTILQPGLYIAPPELGDVVLVLYGGKQLLRDDRDAEEGAGDTEMDELFAFKVEACNHGQCLSREGAAVVAHDRSGYLAGELLAGQEVQWR